MDKQIGHSKKAKTQKKEKLKIQWPVNKEPTIDRKDGDCEIKRLNLEKLNSDEIIFHSNDPAIGSTKSYVVPRDSFFLGGVDPSSEEDEKQEKKPRELERHSLKGKAKDRFNQKPTKSFQKERTHADKKADKFANNIPLGNPRQFGGNSHQRNQSNFFFYISIKISSLKLFIYIIFKKFVFKCPNLYIYHYLLLFIQQLMIMYSFNSR